MKKKPSHRWLDAQVVIGSLSVAASLGLWRLFAVAPQPVAASAPPTSTEPVVDSAAVSTQVAPLASLPSTRILLGGAAPRPPSSDSGGGPAPVTSTSSSRP